MNNRNRVVALSGGLSAHIQASLLQAAEALSRPLGFRGVQRYAWLLNRCFSHRNSAIIALAPGGTLRINLGDGYWATLLSSTFLYEPEIGFVLSKALQQEHAFFFDCGANIGYWSAVAATLINRPEQVLAIEASPPCFEDLAHNARLNNHSFHCIMGAVWSQDSEELLIVTHDKRHAGSSVVNRRDRRGQKGYGEYKVPSVTLDTLCESYVTDKTAKVVIKLDVEGAEIPCLTGARRLLRSRETLVMYEDHVQDRDSKVSAYILDKLGYDVYYCTQTFEVIKMAVISDVQHAKTNGRLGHNFFACSPTSAFSSMFDEMIAGNERANT